MTNVLMTLVHKVDNIQEQMSQVNRVMEITINNQKKILEMKNILTEMKNSFKRPKRHNEAEEKISELEDLSI